MAYIEVHQSLRDHRKILALAAELDMPEPHVAGHCLYLWLWSLDNAEDGVLPASERIVERAACWQGMPGAFVTGMVCAGMLDRDEDGSLHIHDWWEYAGRFIEKRRQNADRMRSARASSSRGLGEGRATHVQPTFDARAGATEPYRTVPNRTEPYRTVMYPPLRVEIVSGMGRNLFSSPLTPLLRTRPEAPAAPGRWPRR